MFVKPGHIIQNASSADQSNKKVADGIIQSAMLTSFQRQAMDGILDSAMPEKKGPAMKAIQKTKPSKTPQHLGAVHYPGSRFA